MDPYPKLIISIVLLLLNALFTLGGEGMKNLNKALLNRKAEEGNRAARKICSLQEKQGYTFFAALFTARAFCKIGATTLMISAFYTPLYEALAGKLPYPAAFALLIPAGSVLLLFLLFGEIFPSRAAEQKADSITYAVWGSVYPLACLFYPIAAPVAMLSSGLLKLCGFQQSADDALSKEEIQSVVEESGESGLLEEAERDMLEGILSFDEKTADQVMTPRTEVFLIDGEQPLKEQMDEILNEKYSRIPVYRGEIDNIIGILYLKDYFCEAYRVGFENVDLARCMRDVYFVPEKKKLDRLYRDLQESKNHMAVLIDEYGGFSGIVTIEDLIEEVMGDINDEYDEKEIDILSESDGSFLAEGSATIAEVNEQLGTDLNEEDDDYDTVNGFIIKLLGYIPEEDELPSFEHGGFSFHVESIADRRIERVRIKRLQEEPDDTKGNEN